MDNDKELQNLVKQVVIAGYTPEEARNMSIADAMLVCECFKERMKIEKQIRAYYDYILGQVIAMNIWGTKDKKPIPLAKLYPDLFGEKQDKNLSEEEKEEIRLRNVEAKKSSFMALTHEISQGLNFDKGGEPNADD